MCVCDVGAQPLERRPLFRCAWDSERTLRAGAFAVFECFLGSALSPRAMPPEVFRRAAWRLARWIRHRGGRMLTVLSSSPLRSRLTIAPATVLEALASARRRLGAWTLADRSRAGVGDRSDVWAALTGQHRGSSGGGGGGGGGGGSAAAAAAAVRLSSAGLEALLARCPLGEAGDGGLAGCGAVRLLLRDEDDGGGGSGGWGGSGGASKGAEVVNPPEVKRSYSSVFGNDKVGTGHAQSCLDSVSTLFFLGGGDKVVVTLFFKV